MLTETRDVERRVRALLVDDEPLALDNLRIALASHPDVEIVGEASEAREAVRLARVLAPDLLFLDVQMPDMDGFAVLGELRAGPVSEVIFVTAFDEHALHAFEVHALDYLLKPFDDARFAECVDRAVARIRSDRRSRLDVTLHRLLHELSPSTADAAAGHVRRLAVRRGQRIAFVAVDDIDWLQAAGNYVRVHAGEARHLIRTTISELSARLDPAHFVRIHRSTIVNLDRIREVQPWAGADYVAILKNGQRLRVSRTYRDELLRPLA